MEDQISSNGNAESMRPTSRTEDSIMRCSFRTRNAPCYPIREPARFMSACQPQPCHTCSHTAITHQATLCKFATTSRVLPARVQPECTCSHRAIAHRYTLRIRQPCLTYSRGYSASIHIMLPDEAKQLVSRGQCEEVVNDLPTRCWPRGWRPQTAERAEL